MVILFTPKELRHLAQRSRDEATEIQKGPISHFACDAVFYANLQADDYERDAKELDVAIATIAAIPSESITDLKVRLEIAERNMTECQTQLWHDFDRRLKGELAAPKSTDPPTSLDRYKAARAEYFAVVAKILIVTGKVTNEFITKERGALGNG